MASHWPEKHRDYGHSVSDAKTNKQINKKDPEGVISRSSQPISFIIVSCFVGRFERPFSWSPSFLGYLSAMKNFMSLSFFKESDLRQLASGVF